jgi:ElaB/YqjD/DUF883 family membrane-anchored ribosome-binding protein
MANPSTTQKGKEDSMNNPTLEKAKETGSQAFNKAKDLGSQAMDKAKETASSVGGMMSSAASNVGKTAENLATSAGTGLKHLGETIGQHTPHEGMLGTASQTVASGLREGGAYLEHAGFSGIGQDVTNLIRRNPVPAILVGFGVGFLIGLAMRS